jgi:hypothetical protein
LTAILAIDPGTTHSGWVLIRNGNPFAYSAAMENTEVLTMLRANQLIPVAIEMIASYGMPVGAEVFDTCVWIGRMTEAAGNGRVRQVFRKDVKLHLCGTPRAKDPHVRQALIDKWGGKALAVGTVKTQGPLYGIKSHAWAALGVAVTALETKP